MGYNVGGLPANRGAVYTGDKSRLRGVGGGLVNVSSTFCITDTFLYCRCIMVLLRAPSPAPTALDSDIYVAPLAALLTVRK